LKKKKSDTEKLFSGRIINNSRSMISIINRDYIYEKVNTQFCKAQNSDKRSIIGKSAGDIWGHETFHHLIKDKIDQCFAGKTVRYKAAFSTPGSSGNRKFQITLRPIKTDSRSVTHIYADTFDITDLINLRGDKAHVCKELRSLKSDYENRLQQTGRLAAVGLITEGIVHDFNNLITTISGYAELISDELPAGSTLSEKAEKIIAASERARLLSERLLNISNPSSEEKTSVNVNRILHETINLLRSISPLNIKFIIAIPEKEYLILTDPNQIFRVFLNILTNSIQAMKDRGGTLNISSDIVRFIPDNRLSTDEIPTGKYIHINIRDTGSGITRAQMKRIFEPFNSDKKESGGKGLGMYIVNEIVAEMNGRIKISGRKNSGTSCDLYFPYCGQQDAQ
jgi:signal transduction histidine kinase